jgi:CheY-like chemotaxis protein
MAATHTILCIHRNPDQLTLLRDQGYRLVTAISGSEGLRLLTSCSVDAVVLEYYVGLMDGSVVADEIRRVRPQLPIVMVADPLELPRGTLNSVDALVDRSDGAHFLWAAVHFLLSAKIDSQFHPAVQARTKRRHRPGGTNAPTGARRSKVLTPAHNEKRSLEQSLDKHSNPPL